MTATLFLIQVAQEYAMKMVVDTEYAETANDKEQVRCLRKSSRNPSERGSICKYCTGAI